MTGYDVVTSPASATGGETMIQVHLTDDFMINGLAIYISMKSGPGDRRILRLGEHHNTWEQAEPEAVTKPTLTLNGDAAHALLDALLRHYQGASDMHTVRADLLHERGRVDKLTEAVINIAEGRLA